jgi:hypothetical protein
MRAASKPTRRSRSPADARLPIDAAPIDAALPIDAPPPPPIDAAPPPDACIPQTTQLLANPSFDLDANGTGWTQQPIQNTVCGMNRTPCGPFALISNVIPQSAPYDAFLGGLTADGVQPPQNFVTDQLYQDVTVPAGTTQLVLSGEYIVVSAEDPSDPTIYDTADLALLRTDGSPIEDVLSVNNVTAAAMTTYAVFSYTFATDVSGKAVRVRFTSSNDPINNTNFFFDTLSLEATHCP